MGILKGRGFKSPLSAPSGAPFATRETKSQDQRRYSATPWRRLYNLKRWKVVKLAVLERDGYTCQQTGVALIGAPGAPNSPVVDHIEPVASFWREHGPAKFYDMSNLQAVSKHWHDTVKQRQEAAQRQAGQWGGGG